MKESKLSHKIPNLELQGDWDSDLHRVITFKYDSYTTASLFILCL